MLSEFLQIKKGDVVCFVGGGGKTALLFMLVQELSKSNRIVITSTTKMSAHELPGWIDLTMIETSLFQSEPFPDIKFIKYPVAVFNKIENDKVIGILPEMVDILAVEADIVLVEADGARKLPVKIPKQTEPVIPVCTTKVVVVYGYDGLDQPISKDTCYNINGITERIAGAREGQVLDPPLLRRFFLEGGFIEASRGKEIFIIINKAETDISKAEEFARYLYHRSVSSIAVSSAKDGWIKKVDNRNRKITGVILAAGEGMRFGKSKLLAKVNGMRIIEKTIIVASSPELERMIVILGHERDKILSLLPKEIFQKVVPIFNPDFRTGMSSSIRRGVEEVKDSDAVIFFLGDMPFITIDTTEKIIKAYRDSCAWACRAIAGGRPGHPVIIGKELYTELKNITGDEGAKRILDRYHDYMLTVEVDLSTQKDIDSENDLDTIEDGNYV